MKNEKRDTRVGEFTRQLSERPHFIGIGGVGMSSIALVLLARGIAVSGSDARESDVTRGLREKGAQVAIGHAAGNVAGADAVVVSSAIKEDNPELRAARERGIPVWRRAEVLGALMAEGRSVGVSGAHGKTTTTLMAGHVLIAAGLDPTVLVGGWVNEFGGGARVGAGPVVAEVDESDRSFFNIHPDFALITNIDLDHTDTYASHADIRDAFVRYVNQTPARAVAIVDGDDPGVREAIPAFQRRLVTCSLEDASACVFGEVVEQTSRGSRFRVRFDGADCGEARLEVGGVHNVRNALLAVAAGLLLDADFARCREGLAQFRGVRRRFEFRGQARGARVYDDYAHHPREIEATLTVAAKMREEEGGRVVVVFQPHRYTRTRSFAEAFGQALRPCDALIVTDVYGAGDEPIAGVTGALVAAAARRAGHPDVAYCANLDAVPAALAPRLRAGDIVLTVGAGNVTDVGPAILQALAEKEAAGT